MERSQALSRLRGMCAADTPPELIDDEIDDLLLRATRADRYGAWPDTYTEWRALANVTTATRSVPTIRNGHYYAPSVGRTGTTEPTWPATSGGIVVDGTVTWTEQGATTWLQTWDLNWAAMEGWDIKAGKVSDYAAFGADGQSFNPQQITERCAERSRYYRSRIAPQSVCVGNGDRYGAY